MVYFSLPSLLMFSSNREKPGSYHLPPLYLFVQYRILVQMFQSFEPVSPWETTLPRRVCLFTFSFFFSLTACSYFQLCLGQHHCYQQCYVIHSWYSYITLSFCIPSWIPCLLIEFLKICVHSGSHCAMKFCGFSFIDGLNFLV